MTERRKDRKAECKEDSKTERHNNRGQKDNKVGLAVQFVSNCHSTSKREAYVRELRQFIPVDVYGKCE
jgi:hypothetical protein